MAGCNGASLMGETQHESTSEMKRKAPGAQEPEHMGFSVRIPTVRRFGAA